MNFDEIYIESSPFLRCLQTASRIAEKLRVKKVEVNWLITEHLGDIQFPEADPVPGLTLNKYGVEDLNEHKIHYSIP